MLLSEIFKKPDSTSQFDVSYGRSAITYSFTVGDKIVKLYLQKVDYTELEDSIYVVKPNNPDRNYDKIDILFTVNDSMQVTGKSGTGEAVVIFNNVLAAIDEYLKFHPNTIEFIFTAKEPSRIKFYDRLSAKICEKHSFYRIKLNNTYVAINGRLAKVYRKRTSLS